MPISFKVAKTSKDKEGVYRLRHQVFVLEEKRFEYPMDMIYDVYDSFEETINILAMHEDAPVGTIRVTLENPVGMPPLEHYDFGPLMKSVGGKFAGIGWLCVAEKYRKYRGMVPGLFKMMAREVRKRGGRHLIAPLHPGILPLLLFFGARTVDEEFYSETLNVPMVPIHVDLDALPPGAREVSQDPLNIIFEDSNERRIYRSGETVINKGDLGEEAFLIMRGAVRVVFNPESGKDPTKTARESDPAAEKSPLLGPGQVFGELSLLDEGPRTATVVCHSRECDVMVWSREEFLNQLHQNQEKAYEICRILGTRFRLVIEGFAGAKPKEALVARIIFDASREGKKPVELRWLAAQCGAWRKELEPLINEWAVKGILDCEDEKTLKVINLELLKKKIVMD